ncbi:hypothetical protein VB779_09420 [Haloarculaceae archaeon H-GB11]|nr:hypothetical protein [Haloarculaceae archaeon H-GB11]
MIEGLEAAMHEMDLETKDLNHDEFGQQRLNKLVSAGLYWRYGETLPVQYSWHRYGIELGNAVKDSHLVRPHHPDELPSFTANVGAAQERAREVEEYYHYFKTDFNLGEMDLKEAVLADFHDLLEAFYRRYADEEYRALYLANVKLQRWLSQDAGELDASAVDLDDCFVLADIITELHGELFGTPSLREPESEFARYVETSQRFDNRYQNLKVITETAYDRAQRFTDLLEDIYRQLAETPDDEITGNPASLIESLNVFYHEYVWKQVTEIISIKTAGGRDYREIWEGALEELEWLDESFPDKMETHEEVAKEAGLVPSLHESPFDDEEMETIEATEELASIYEAQE